MADNVLDYKGYSTRVEFSAEDKLLFGKIEGIVDLVNFQSETLDGVEAAFHEAVDDYLAFCKDLGKEPNKVYRGSFNVRVQPSIHRELDRAAARHGVSMNQFVEDALVKAVEAEKVRAPYQKAVASVNLESERVRLAWDATSETEGNIVQFPVQCYAVN